jgi:arylsulfate sulfotransferase
VNVRCGSWMLLLTVLAGCGPSPQFNVTSELGPDLSVIGKPGPTPFIAFLEFSGPNLADVTSVTYTLEPRAGSASRPVKVTYSLAALQRRGAVTETGLSLPVFGLYPGSANQATIEFELGDGSSQVVRTQIATGPYTDDQSVYDHPNILKSREPGSSLGFDFFAMKSGRTSVVVVDTDGEVRWVGSGVPSFATVFTDNGFVVGSPSSGQLQRLELDGTMSTSQVADPAVVDFSHNIDPGKVGLLAELDVTGETDATVEEITPTGDVLGNWRMGDLLSAYMASQGDDPTAFVRHGQDWFHLNAATYDPRDDTLIVSSRENFLIKIDYATGQPIWILGDPTKYWYSFPSLRAKALTLAPGGLYPVGQHATSITADGLLMVFNDGTASLNQPTGQPAGDARTYSTVSAYAIDPGSMTAREVWRFEHQPELYSQFCSSAYQTGQSLLVDYAQSDDGRSARILGLDTNRQVIFEIAYANANGGCNTSWNAVPVPLDALRFE